MEWAVHDRVHQGEHANGLDIEYRAASRLGAFRREFGDREGGVSGREDPKARAPTHAVSKRVLSKETIATKLEIGREGSELLCLGDTLVSTSFRDVRFRDGKKWFFVVLEVLQLADAVAYFWNKPAGGVSSNFESVGCRPLRLGFVDKS